MNGALLFATELTPIPSTRSLAVKNGASMRATRQRRRKRSTAASPISTAACSAARRTAACSPTTSRLVERLWETAIADPKKSESAPAAPIAWNGLVFIGNAGGDFKGVKGRMYALDAADRADRLGVLSRAEAAGDPTAAPRASSPLDTSSWDVAAAQPISGGATWTSYTLDPDDGAALRSRAAIHRPTSLPRCEAAAISTPDSVVVLDAKTGAYSTHFKLVPKDWHDWDVSSAPAIVTTAAGKRVMLVAPKDGYLYGFDLDTKEMLYRVPVTAIENADVPFSATEERAFLSRVGRRRRMERAGIQPAEQSRHDR